MKFTNGPKCQNSVNRGEANAAVPRIASCTRNHIL